jgi:hypothetical protein
VREEGIRVSTSERLLGFNDNKNKAGKKKIKTNMVGGNT